MRLVLPFGENQDAEWDLREDEFERTAMLNPSNPDA
jgi:hypothetical protein